MTDSVRLLGPRGWAALILASGAALSAPFLRNPGNTPPDEQPNVGTLPQVAATPSTWPDLHERSLTPPQAAANLTEQDWAELSRLQKISGASPRKVTGELPSTSGPSKLPAWADRGPRIDQVVKETLVTDSLPPLANAGVNPAHQNSAHQNSALEPFRPWMGDGLKSKVDAPAIAESSASDFAMAQRDPDARWSNAPNSTHAEFSGATTSNGSLVRKFENKVAQWPDEIVAPPQFFEQSRQQALASRDATRPNVNWPSTAGSTQPLPAPGIGQIVNVPIRQSLGDVASQPGAQDQQTATAQINLPSVNLPSVNLPSGNLPNSNVQNAAVMPPAFALQPTMQPTAPIQPSVTAPMISSQSGRPANRPLDPSIEATKPKSDTPRPKHFIQQPTKRA